MFIPLHSVIAVVPFADQFVRVEVVYSCLNVFEVRGEVVRLGIGFESVKGWKECIIERRQLTKHVHTPRERKVCG